MEKVSTESIQATLEALKQVNIQIAFELKKLKDLQDDTRKKLDTFLDNMLDDGN